MSARGGPLVYKCRMCGGLDESLHAPDVMAALVFIGVRGETPREWGIVAGRTSLHHCADGSLGVSDIIGGRPDPEAGP